MKKEKMDQYVSILLEDDSDFFLQGFKILNKYQEKGFLSCMKVRHNGMLKLLYRTGTCFSLYDWMKKEGQEKEQGIKIIEGIVETVFTMKTNGFLKVSNLFLDPDMIFIDGNSYHTYMIALPLGHPAENQEDWQHRLTGLLMQIADFAGIEPDFLGVPDASVEYIHRSLEIYRISGQKKSEKKKEQKKVREIPSLVLEYVEGDLLRQIRIEKGEFVLGKKSSMADGVIEGVPTVSRRHCRITRSDEGYQVTDLGSLNGTYVNQIKVREGEKAVLRPGDVLRLANLELRVRAGR